MISDTRVKIKHLTVGESCSHCETNLIKSQKLGPKDKDYLTFCAFELSIL